VKYPLIQVTGSRSGNTSVLKKLRRDGSVCVCANALRPVALLCMTSALLTTCGRVCLCVCKRVEASHFDMHDFSTTDNVCMCVCAKVESHSWRGRACFKHTHTHKHIPDTFHCFPGSSEKLYTLRPEQRGVNGRKAQGLHQSQSLHI